MNKVDVSKYDIAGWAIPGLGEPFFVVDTRRSTPMSFGFALAGYMLRDAVVGSDDRFVLSDADGHRQQVTCVNVSRDTADDCTTVFTEPQQCEKGEVMMITVSQVEWNFTKGPLCLYKREQTEPTTGKKSWLDKLKAFFES